MFFSHFLSGGLAGSRRRQACLARFGRALLGRAGRFCRDGGFGDSRRAFRIIGGYTRYRLVFLPGRLFFGGRRISFPGLLRFRFGCSYVEPGCHFGFILDVRFGICARLLSLLACWCVAAVVQQSL